MDEIRTRLKVAREGLGLNTREAAEAVRGATGGRTSHTSVANYEDAEGAKPSVEYLAGFCAGLGVSSSWLLFGVGEMRHTEVGEAEAKLATIRAVLDGELTARGGGAVEEGHAARGRPPAGDNEDNPDADSEDGRRTG